MKSRIRCNGQFGQDFFVTSILQGQTGGFFVDIGCGTSTLDLNHVPISAMSNTYILENSLGWDGIALDYDEKYCKKAEKYRPSVSCVNLMEENINDVLAQRNCPDHFDYLSFDVDEAQRKVLDEMDFDKYSFRILTYEHNFSTEKDPRYNGKYNGDQAYSREKFADLGYHILFGNVGITYEQQIEDWYVNDELFEKWKHLQQENTTLQDIISKLR